MFKLNGINEKSFKENLWVSVGFSIAGIVNLIIFAILSSLQIVPISSLSYVFAVGFIAAVWVPFFIQIIFKTDFNLVVLICYQIFLALSIVVGSLWRVYDFGLHFDKIVHFVSGVLFALIVYNLFVNNKKNRLSLFWVFVLTFSFAMMCGGVWEIYEFTFDGLLGNNAQSWLNKIGREALNDTMLDLVCDFVGSVLGGIAAVLLEWKKKKSDQQQTKVHLNQKESV